MRAQTQLAPDQVRRMIADFGPPQGQQYSEGRVDSSFLFGVLGLISNKVLSDQGIERFLDIIVAERFIPGTFLELNYLRHRHAHCRCHFRDTSQPSLQPRPLGLSLEGTSLKTPSNRRSTVEDILRGLSCEGFRPRNREETLVGVLGASYEARSQFEIMVAIIRR